MSRIREVCNKWQDSIYENINRNPKTGRKHMSGKLGYVKVTKIKGHKDGSATVDVEYDKAFADAIKKHLGIKRLTKKRLNTVVKAAFIAGAAFAEKELSKRKK